MRILFYFASWCLCMSFLGVECRFCTWDMSFTPEKFRHLNCGYICPDPWDHADPHYCGTGSPCCCMPKCDFEQARAETFLGINWSDQFMHHKTPRTFQLQILKNNGFKHIKVFSTSGIADIAATFGNNPDDVYVYLGLPNRQIQGLVDPETAEIFVRRYVKPYSNIIKLLLLGNEPLICIQSLEWAARSECGTMELPAKVLPAMKAVHLALVKQNLTHIKITSPLNGGILDMATNPWTACSADFIEKTKVILLTILDFLKETSAPLVVNIYPWFAVKDGSIKPSLGTGYTKSQSFDGDFAYVFNFDIQLDMIRIALCKHNASEIEVIVGETGWPSAGHPLATLEISQKYHENVIKRSKGQLIHDVTIDRARFANLGVSIFLFEAFDESRKHIIEHGNEFENHFGLFTELGMPKWEDENGMLDLDIRGKNAFLSENPARPLELTSLFHQRIP